MAEKCYYETKIVVHLKKMSAIKELHDRDFNLWIEKIKEAIQNRDFEDMDWENLLDEIDDMGKSEKRSLESYLEQLIFHLLKPVEGDGSYGISHPVVASLSYWESEKERNYKHWKAEVINFRNRIARLIKRNPSFKKYMQEIYPEIFQDVVKSAQVEFEIANDNFISLDKTLDENYFGL